MKPGGSASGTVSTSSVRGEAEKTEGWRTTAVSPASPEPAVPAPAVPAVPMPAVWAAADEPAADFFAQPVRDQVSRCIGRPASLLRAGGQTPLAELGLHRLRELGYEISVQTIDVDDADLEPAEGDIVLGDLRTIPLPPRSFDIVHCSLLLDRIGNAPLVLDRFIAALRPGGILLLRIRDRDCAAGWLDRKLPGLVRGMLWRQLRPGEPGPFPAVYEPTSSASGIAAYVLNRGLVVSQRRATRNMPHQPERLCRFLSALRKVVAGCSRGRLTDAHDQVLFVIRKPEDRFARVVLAGPFAAGRRTRT